TALWDRRVCVLQVTDATGAAVRVRALVSAADAPTLWDLRCLVRERLVDWVREQQPQALPRVRAEVAAPAADGAGAVAAALGDGAGTPRPEKRRDGPSTGISPTDRRH